MHFLLHLFLAGHIALAVGPTADFITTRRAIRVGAIETSFVGQNPYAQAAASFGTAATFEILAHYCDKDKCGAVAPITRWTWGGLTGYFAYRNVQVRREQIKINEGQP